MRFRIASVVPNGTLVLMIALPGTKVPGYYLWVPTGPKVCTDILPYHQSLMSSATEMKNLILLLF